MAKKTSELNTEKSCIFNTFVLNFFELFIMKHFILFILLGISIGIRAQTPTWVNVIGSLGNDDSYSLDIDDSNNVYVTGWFSGTVDFDPGPNTFNLTSSGMTDVFVAKYTMQGNLLWAFRIGQNDRDGAMKVKINNAGEILLTGFVRQNNIDFDPGPGIYYLNAPGVQGTDPGHSGDIFLAKYTSSGQFIWAFIISGSYNSDIGENIEVDSLDNIYLTGAINATSTSIADADPGPGVYNLAGPNKGHAFVAKYTTNSTFLWAFQLGTYGFNSSVKRIKIVPGDTTFIVCGHHISSNADFDPGPGIFNLNSNGNVDMFTGRYSLNGKFIWAFGVGGTQQDLGMEVRIDSLNNVYVSGSFGGNNLDFDPSTNISLINCNGLVDGYIAKYDIAGNYIWAINIGGLGNDYNWTFDIFGNKIISCGEYSLTADFDPSVSNYNLVSSGLSDAYFAHFDLNGNFLCANSIGDIGNDRIFYMEKITADTFLTCGSFSNNVDFDPGLGSLVGLNNGLYDGFVCKHQTFGNTVINAQVIGDTVCYNESAFITIVFPPGINGPFNVSLSDGVNLYNLNNILSGVPFMIPNILNSTTTITIISITSQSSSSCYNNFSLLSPFANILVLPPPSVMANANPTNLCLGETTTLLGSGGMSQYWMGGFTSGTPFTPSSTSTYTLVGTDANGCTNTSTVTITVNPLPNIVANANPNPVCSGQSTYLTASGGINYIWSNGIVDGDTIYPIATSTYTVIGTDANGCSNTSSITINIVESLPINISPFQTTLCKGDSVMLTASGANLYDWNPIPGLSNYSGPVVWAFPIYNTEYIVTGTDINGCTGTASVNIDVIESIDIQVNKNRDAECNLNNVQLFASGANNYIWTPALYLSNPNNSITDAQINNTTTFYVTGMTGSCTDMDSITVYYYNNDENSIFIPNSFSPNDDGLNDCYRIRHQANFKEYYFTIYNRWGERVFETNSANECWDGKFKNGLAEIGTYFYYLKAETNCGKVFRKGDIILIK